MSLRPAPGSVPQTIQSIESEETAKKEQERFALSQNLEEASKINAHHRLEGYKKYISRCITSVILAGFIAGVVIFLLWAVHLILPAGAGWIEVKNLDKIETIFITILTALIGGLITELGRQYL